MDEKDFYLFQTAKGLCMQESRKIEQNNALIAPMKTQIANKKTKASVKKEIESKLKIFEQELDTAQRRYDKFNLVCEDMIKKYFYEEEATELSTK